MAVVDNSFPKSGRLRKRSDYLFVQKSGVSTHGQYFVLVWRESSRNRLGITVSKRVGNAVVRNRVRRLVREFARCNFRWRRVSSDVVVIAKKSAGMVGAQELWAELACLGKRLRSRRQPS